VQDETPSAGDKSRLEIRPQWEFRLLNFAAPECPDLPMTILVVHSVSGKDLQVVPQSGSHPS
jgi:hypothetical protein